MSRGISGISRSRVAQREFGQPGAPSAGNWGKVAGRLPHPPSSPPQSRRGDGSAHEPDPDGVGDPRCEVGFVEIDLADTVIRCDANDDAPWPQRPDRFAVACADKARSNSERPGVAHVLHRMACPNSLSIGASTRESPCLIARAEFPRKRSPLNDARSACACQRAPLTDAQAAFNDERGRLTVDRCTEGDDR